MNVDFPGKKYFKGGGGGSAAPTVVSTPPPPTQTSIEVQQAKRDTMKQAAKRKGVPQTILAGETGGFGGTVLGGNGFGAPGQGQQKNNLLGGG